MAPIVAIIGSRDWLDLMRVRHYVQRLAAKHPDAIVVSGGAKGVDKTAEKEALHIGLELISFRPYSFDSIYDRTLFTIETVTQGDEAQRIVVDAHYRISPPCFPTYTQAAKHRNGWIVDVSDQVVAFWDGRSRGTSDSIEKAKKTSRPLYTLTPH